MPERQRMSENTRIPLSALLFCALVMSAILCLFMPALGPIFPGSNSSRHRQMEITVEIVQFEQGLMSFKAEYGRLPPSRLTIPEDGESWQAIDRIKLRRIWPQFEFERQRDLNHDGDTDDVHTLTGAECLVFFLGGLRGASGALVGFSKNPLWPFSETQPNRSAPFFEFDNVRFTDVDEDGFCEYGDSLTCTRFLYVASEQKRLRDADLVVYPIGDRGNMQLAYARKHGRNGFQIISAGEDGEDGIGGEYSDVNFEFPPNRRDEQDNMTNFSTGTLSGIVHGRPRTGLFGFYVILFSPIAFALFFYLANALFSIRRTIAGPDETHLPR